MLSWTRAVTADSGSGSYVVHASVPGPPPTDAATIDTPLNGAAFTEVPIKLTGSCPVGTYVEILRNGFSSGVALCSAAGFYEIQIDLFAGVNQLIARDYSFTDQAGPDSGITTIVYNPPGKPPVTNGGTGSTPYTPGVTSGVPVPLLLKANYTFVGYYVGTPVTWQLRIEGGSAPYAVQVDWGDGKSQLYSIKDPSALSIQHVYGKTGAYHGSYPVKIQATDTAGNHTYLQLVAIISNRPKTVIGTGAGTTGGGGFHFDQLTSVGNIVTYVWSTYGLVILMLISFWLGERRELFVMRHSKRKGHHA